MNSDSTDQLKKPILSSNHNLPLIILSGMVTVYGILMLRFISAAYLDFGDGNYLYIAWRMTQGVVIYRDILSPQPPFHLLLGVMLLKLGALINNPLLAIRIFTILLRISHAFLIYLICQKLWAESDNKRNIGALAGIIYLFLPIGFWWSRGFETEPVEITWMLLTLIFFLRNDWQGMTLAGIFSAVGILTNMTFAPYFGFNILYLVFGFIYTKYRKQTPVSELGRYRLLTAYVLPALIILGIVTFLFSWYTNGQFLQNIIFDQVGTYPKEHTLLYMFGKMKWIGTIILSLEGPLIFACLIGLYLYSKKINPQSIIGNAKWYVILYSLATLGSFVFATKGGTVDYIFTLGEPTVAIFSSALIVLLIKKITAYLKPILSWSIGIILLLLLAAPGIRQDILTLWGTNYELNAAQMSQVVETIQHYTQPDDMIFAPPYFAFLAERKIVGEFSEQFVWYMKYANYIRYREGNPKTMDWIAQMANLIENKQVKLIMLNIDPNRGQQTGQIRPIRQAVEANYVPIGELEMRNETLTIFLPK
ncbi:MAG: ArnT family glycosyltransferase [bacterium]